MKDIPEYERFTISHFTFSGESKVWEDAYDVRKVPEGFMFFDNQDCLVIISGGTIEACQNEPMPEEIVSESGLVIPQPKEFVKGL